ALTRLGKECAHAERGGIARLEVPQEIREREAARADALDHEDVLALDGIVEVLSDAHDAGGARLRIRHGRDEVEGGGNGELAHQVGDEQRGALEHADQMKVLVGIVPRDLGAEPRHLLLDGRRLEQHVAEAVDGARHHTKRAARRNSRASPTRARSASPAASASSKHWEMVRTEWSV